MSWSPLPLSPAALYHTIEPKASSRRGSPLWTSPLLVIRPLLPPRLLAGASALSLAAALAAPPAAFAQAAPDPSAVKIASCAITKPRPFSHHPTGTEIAFTNTGPVVLHGVTFKVDYRTAEGTLTRSFEDAGLFAPNEAVKHHYAAYTDVDYAGPTPASCTVTSVR